MLSFKKSAKAIKKFRLQFKNNQPFEFYFYTDKEDDADNLTITLHALGYTIYQHTSIPELPGTPFSVIGHTGLLSTKENCMDAWCLQMEQIAVQHNCRFDGWGTLIE